ncbi:hypothetical protein BKA67DRAFT_562088 [Truncatella angustata]|uniref:Uncharacterized protein n=1 Tax=Truncatella angustata TaxID=152316 RepID=A0A9P8UPM8_9PEZI|nr:uncharacterized protein BKA67DRAFT_562088 [Truncatella angustata]KAH6655895.1 hypothetical protein BKA67DRAFT_562088 [Truncatella angustata]
MPPMTPTTSIDTSVSSSSNTRAVHSPRHDRSRTQSISSDRPSTIAHSLMSLPLAVSPEAAFIAASAASQIVTNDHDGHSETWYDQAGIEPSGETALVTGGALLLANNFIDQLLFNIIAVARSTKLSALRPAVSEVLKPHLAKDAINQADEELKEYLGGGELDELAQSPTDDPDDWDLELVWKRTRLRCMVYSSLGDMEEEDEDYFIEQEHLNGDLDDLSTGSVSPAVAIFLTSILEYMGEQVLVIAGQAAFARLRIRYEKELKDGTRSAGDISERIVVEELDMERVALDRTLGRLWRSWKKRIRSPTEPNFVRPFPRSAGHSRHGSAVTEALHTLSSPREESAVKEAEGANEELESELNPSDLPLPMSNNDVAEIEVPGLVSYSDDEENDGQVEDEATAQRPRPKSLMVFSSLPQEAPLPPSPRLSQPHTPIYATRRRASSLPTPAGSPYTSPIPTKGDQLNQEQHTGEETVAGMPSVVISKTGEAPEATTDRKVNEDGVSPLDTDASDYIDGKTPEDTSPISMIVSGAAALGAAAVAGVTAMAQGAAPQTIPTPMEDDEIDEFTEEPEIMTSSRVSYGGRSSPSASESGIDRPTRPPSMILVRSNSVRSVRVIDVQGPRTPSIKSRNGSIDVPDMPTRPVSMSREGSVSTPPIVEEGFAAPDALSIKATKRNAAIVPPSEERRDFRSSRDASPSGVVAPMPSAPTSTPSQNLRQAPTSVPAANDTKVTVLNSAPGGRSFLDLDTKPEVPQKAPMQQSYQQSYHQPQRYPSPLPTVPEKSSARKPSIDRTQPATTRGSPESPTLARPKLSDSPSSSTSNKYKPMRNSEDGGSQRPQDVAKNFEELLQNNQTIQYTLTPENMRNIDAPNRSGSPIVQHKSRRSEDVKQADRSRSSSLKRSLSVTKSAGLNSHPPDQGNKSNGKLAGPVPRAPPVSMANYHARAAGSGQPRDARIPRESVSDFADFIRSTGPAGGNVSNARATPVGGAMQHARNASGSVSQTSSTDTTRPRQGSLNRIRLQARDAAVSTSNESSDLIDFIRRGPPTTGSNPRIPRNVAPFRNTMDSDQMQMSGAGGGKAIDATIPEVRHSRASTTVTETSLPSSINSQSALLSQAKKPTNHTNKFDEDDMMPKRKQRRVRDPYAIDSSDEEEGEDDDDFDITPQPKPKPKKEESLIDFLNNYAPPSNAAPPQPFITAQAPQPAPKKKASAPSLMSRFRSAGSGSSSATKNNGPSATNPRSVSSQMGSARGHVPISAHMPNSVAAFSNQPQPSANRAVSSSSGSRVLMKKYEPRDATSSGMGRTSDLASFLRDSEPPPSAIAAPVAQPEPRLSSGISSVFGRRKKSIAY